MEQPKRFTGIMRGGGIPSPQLFSSMQKVGVVRDGAVNFAGHEFAFEDGHLPDGTEVVLSLVNAPGPLQIWFESLRERETFDAWMNEEWERRRREQEAERTRREEERRVERERIVADLRERVPFRWSSGIKVVYSGVREHSHLTGTYARSVNHIAPLDDIDAGRFKRKAKEFLCSPDPGRMFAHVDDEDRTQCPTCPKCMEIVERLIRHPKLTVVAKDRKDEEDEPSSPRP